MMMMMMNMEESSGTSNDHQSVVKGKRTKRPRPPSSSSTSSSNGGELSNSSGIISTSTEEDEDMANCLILLARGGGSPESNNKVSSRKFTEMATTTNGKFGFYVYECKTCSRAFPSFQALGGHRASHKKPKVVDNDRKYSPPSTTTTTTDAREDEKPAAPPPLAQPAFNKSCHGGETKPKVHECLTCGAEFASGQALGGHMRRHRSAVIGTRSSANDHSNSANGSLSSDDGEKTGGVLVLDLNLPAPVEDDRRETMFHQPCLVLSSSAALVDCHF